MALELFKKKFMDAASKAYKKSLAGELNKMGKKQGKKRAAKTFFSTCCHVDSTRKSFSRCCAVPAGADDDVMASAGN